MPEAMYSDMKKNVVAIGRLLWEKDLVSVLNGNISARIDAETIVLTATKTCLGLLQEKDVLAVKLDGNVLEEGEVSSERPLHTAIYKNFPEVKAIIHTHTVYTNAYFLENDSYSPRIFESRFWFGEINAVEQLTPSVSEVAPVVEALRKNSVAVLKNHGVVAIGKDLFSCFLLIQGLEDAMKMEAAARLFKAQGTGHKAQGVENPSLVAGLQSSVSSFQSPVSSQKIKAKSLKQSAVTKKYKLFSKEQISEIVKRANSDAQLKELGAKTKMTMTLAVKSAESGKVFSFHFNDGKIVKVGSDEKAEFLLTAPDNTWRAVFNQEIDPFVATTQKKIILKGEFAKLSRWYAPCKRIFEIWNQVPVE